MQCDLILPCCSTPHIRASYKPAQQQMNKTHVKKSKISITAHQSQPWWVIRQQALVKKNPTFLYCWKKVCRFGGCWYVTVFFSTTDLTFRSHLKTALPVSSTSFRLSRHTPRLGTCCLLVWDYLRETILTLFTSLLRITQLSTDSLPNFIERFEYFCFLT